MTAAADTVDVGRPPPAAAPLAVIEALDRDGQPRQSLVVRRWPVTVGRALDGDLVLGDPHVAARHLTIAPAEGGLEFALGATRNGASIGARHLAGGSRTVVPIDPIRPLELTVGRTLLRLRLAGQPVAEELPLAPPLGRRGKPSTLVVAALAVLVDIVGRAYLDTDPDAFARSLAMQLLGGLGGAAIWCGTWALLSKTFTRQARFGWHVRVFLLAAVALFAVQTLPMLVAFALSWPWLSDFDFAGTIAVVAAALYFHLLAVEPAHPGRLRVAAVACGVAGIAIAMWFNVQRVDQLGDELYMSHLFPPALRLARPKPVATLVDRLGSLKDTLDRKAREPGDSDEGGGPDDER